MAEDLNVDWREWTDSEYLAGWEVVKSGDQTLTIKNVTKKLVHNPRQNKKVEVVVLEFTQGKSIVLNKINRKSLTLALKSPIMAKWIGGVITVTTEHGTWFGEEGDAIRIKSTAPTGTKPPLVTPIKLPVLAKGDEKWDGAVKWLVDNKATPFDELCAKLEKQYEVTPALKRQLEEKHGGK